MRPLAALERFLERLFERQTARLFRTGIQPIQVQRRVERAMEGGRTRDGGRTRVPHVYLVRLAPRDLAALTAARPELAAELADAALAFARGHGFLLADRPRIRLVADQRVERGDIVVLADAATVAGARTDAALDGRSGSGAEPTATEHTAVFIVPGAEGPTATLREIRPNGTTREVLLEGRPLTLGRAGDNGLVLADNRASRHHARIDVRRGSLVLSDLGSTNGSWVNGRRVDQIALGEGDRIRIGDTTIVVEALDPSGAAGERSA
jgi:Protein of unknown function (DUF3662)/FHA domain